MLPAHACRRAASLVFDATPPGTRNVWISDAQLASVWESFVSSFHPQHIPRRHFTTSTSTIGRSKYKKNTPQKDRLLYATHCTASTRSHDQVRFGSNVPGPLEARRRLAKRRMTALTSESAVPTGGSYQIPALIGPDLQWIGNTAPKEPKLIWHSPSILTIPPTSELPPKKAPWPEWLFGPLRSDNEFIETRPANEALHEAPEKEKDIQNEQQDQICTKQEWYQELLLCYTIEDIKETALRKDVTLTNASMSQLAFQRLMETDSDLDTYLDFLSDRRISPAEASNISVYLRDMYCVYSHNQVVKAHPEEAARVIEGVERWLQSEVALGSLTEEELRDILEASSIPYEYHSGPPYVSQRAIVTIWKGIKASRIRKIEDLQEETISGLFKSLGRMYKADEGIRLASEVVHALNHSQHAQNMALISKGIWNFVESFMHGSSKELSPNFRDGRSVGREKFIFELLDTLPTELRRASVATVMLQLVHEAETARYPQKRDQRLKWLEFFLHDISSKRLVQTLRTDSRTAAMWTAFETKVVRLDGRMIAAYLGALPGGDMLRCVFLLDHFVLPQVVAYKPRRSTGKKSQLPAIELRKEALHRMGSSHETRANPYITLLDWIHQRALGKLQLIMVTLLSICRHLTDPSMLQSLITHAQALDARIPTTSLYLAINQLSRTSPSHALQVFLANPNLRLEHLPRLAVAIIESQEIHTNVLFPLLNRTLFPKHSERGHNKYKPPNLQTITFLHFLAHRLATSESHEPSRALKTVRRILARCPPSERLRDRSGSPLAEPYRLFTADEKFSLPEAVQHAALKRRLDAGDFVPGGVKKYALKRVQDWHGDVEAEKVYDDVVEYEERIRTREFQREKRAKRSARKRFEREESARRQETAEAMVRAGNAGITSYTRDM